MNREIHARMAWAAVTEPNDHFAGAIIATLGGSVAWELLEKATQRASLTARGQLTEVLVEAGFSESATQRAVSRWSKRCGDLDVGAIVRATDLLGARVLIPEMPQWPEQLNDLGHGAPHCLWVRGEYGLARQTIRGVALVGSRANTSYGEHVTAELVSQLVNHGCPVISGGAFGIDAVAHRMAIALGGRTLAVLAGGIDRLYPAGNAKLLQAIVENGGALLSELPPGALPMKSRFLARNRLIAALSSVTVVVEAAWRSGSLSTAHHALEVGRTVGAVPGPITSAQSAGCHRLLKEGPVEVVSDPRDIVTLLGMFQGSDQIGVENSGSQRLTASRTASSSNRENGQERSVVLSAQELRVLDGTKRSRGSSLEEIAVNAGLLDSEVLEVIGGLEMKGLISRDIFGWLRA